MEETKQELKNKDFWTNVRDLVQINLMQQKNITIGMCLALLVYLILLNICTAGAFYSSKTVEYYYIINGFDGIILIGIFCVLLQEYQLFSSESISMYPGNAMTRFLGRMIADYIRIFLFVLSIGVAYFIQYGLLWMLLHGKAGVDVQVFFDIRYLGAGLLRIGALSMALYGAFALFFAVDAKFGHKCSIAVLVGIPVIVGVSWENYGEFLFTPLIKWVQRWITENTNLFSYLGIIVLIWLLCIMASGMLAYGIRYWRMSRLTEFIIIPIGIFLTSLFIVAGADSYDGENTKISDAVQDEEEYLYCTVLVDMPEEFEAEVDEDIVDLVAEDSGKKCGSLLSYINSAQSAGYTVGGVCEAAELELPEDMDLSGIDDNHALVIFQIPNIELTGKEIFRDMVEEMQGNLKQAEGSKKLKLEYRGKLKSTICMDFFPSVDRFLYHDNWTLDEYYHAGAYVSTLFLMSDARYQKFNEEMDEMLEE